MAPDLEEPYPAGKLLSAGDLRQQIDAFVDHYNHRRYHESLQNLTRPPMSTSDAARPSCNNEKGSN